MTLYSRAGAGLAHQGAPGSSGQYRADTGRGSLVDQAFDILCNRIIDLIYPPGTRLNERDVIQDLGLGRTPIREAFNRVAAVGLIDIEPNKGPTVCSLDMKGTEQIFDAYLVVGRIEASFCNLQDPGLAEDVQLCQRNHAEAIKARKPIEVSYWNARLHERIAATSNNDLLIDFSKRVHIHARRLNVIVYRVEMTKSKYYPEQQQSISDGMHRQLNDALQRQDRAALTAALDAQSVSFRSRFANAISDFDSEIFGGFSAIVSKPAVGQP